MEKVYKKIQRAVDIIQANPIYNEMVSDALTLIPLGGPVLSKYWNKYRESKDIDPRDDILNTLNTMNRMDEARLESFCQMIDHNQDQILENTNKLNELVSLQNEILDELRIVNKTTTNVEKIVTVNQEKLDELIEGQKMIQKFLGITKTIEPDTKIHIPENILQEVKQKDEEIQRLTIELEKANHKPKIDLDYLLKKGNLYYNAEEYGISASIFDLILKNDPKNPFALYNKGIAIDNSGNPQEALLWFDKALEIEPNNLRILNSKSYTLLRAGRFEESIDCADKVLSIEQNYFNAQNNKGIALTRLGRPEESLKCYDEALKIEPNLVDAIYQKGIALDNLGKHEEAIEVFNKAIEKSPNNTSFLNSKGFVLKNLNRYDEAIEVFNKVLKIDPNHQDAKIHLLESTFLKKNKEIGNSENKHLIRSSFSIGKLKN